GHGRTLAPGWAYTPVHGRGSYEALDNRGTCACRGVSGHCCSGACTTLGPGGNATIRRVLLRGHQLRRALLLHGRRDVDAAGLVHRQRRDLVDPTVRQRRHDRLSRSEFSRVVARDRFERERSAGDGLQRSDFVVRSRQLRIQRQRLSRRPARVECPVRVERAVRTGGAIAAEPLELPGCRTNRPAELPVGAWPRSGSDAAAELDSGGRQQQLDAAGPGIRAAAERRVPPVEPRPAPVGHVEAAGRSRHSATPCRMHARDGGWRVRPYRYGIRTFSASPVTCPAYSGRNQPAFVNSSSFCFTCVRYAAASLYSV